jgi:hypothetical protein
LGKFGTATTVFELSYEVANYRGGIGSVLLSKAPSMMKVFPKRFICLGPLLSGKERMEQEVRLDFKKLKKI